MKRNAILPISRRIAGLFVAASLMLAGACKKDTESSPPPPPPDFKLSEYRANGDFVKFTYQPDGKVASLLMKNELNTDGDEVQFDIEYDNNGHIASLTSSSGETVVPVYDNNHIARSDFFMEGVRTGYANFHYDAQGNCEQATIYAGSDPDYEPLLEFRYEYDASGNCSQAIIFVPGNQPGLMIRAGHSDFQYDSKTNPLYAYRELMAMFWQPVSKNNVLREDEFDAQLHPTDRTTYTYQYKPNGLPDLAQSKQGLPGMPQTIGTVQFIYE